MPTKHSDAKSASEPTTTFKKKSRWDGLPLHKCPMCQMDYRSNQEKKVCWRCRNNRREKTKNNVKMDCSNCKFGRPFELSDTGYECIGRFGWACHPWEKSTMPEKWQPVEH